MGIHRAGQGIQAWPGHSGMPMHGQGIHRVHGHFFVSLGRGQGVHGHGLYGQAPGHGQGTFPPPHALALTCGPPLNTER